MKTHYAPNDDYMMTTDRAMCGIRFGDNPEFDMRWEQVTCKLCQKNKEKIEASLKSENDDYINQLSDMAEFLKTNHT